MTEPQRTGDGSLTLHSEAYGQTFHSLHGAAAEARHVYLEGSGVAAALADGKAVRVLEVGFGTGLNCWLAADAAVRTGAQLELVSLEKSLLSADTVRGLEFGHLLHDPALLDVWLEFRAGLPDFVPPGALRVGLAPGVSLQVLVGEARQASLPGPFDVVWHDAFSPEANPELWDEAFLEQLWECLRPGGVLVTYSVKGTVRRLLAGLGFEVVKLPGPPGGKREMLRAQRAA